MKRKIIFLMVITLILTACSHSTIESVPIEEGDGYAEIRPNTVLITSSDFRPITITINQGDTITWINQESKESWPASNIHPTHTLYPGSSLCEEFDSCMISPGESWSFTFNEVGTWIYHDHLNPSLEGLIEVK